MGNADANTGAHGSTRATASAQARGGRLALYERAWRYARCRRGAGWSTRACSLLTARLTLDGTASEVVHDRDTIKDEPAASSHTTTEHDKTLHGHALLDDSRTVCASYRGSICAPCRGSNRATQRIQHDYLPRRYRPSQHGDHGRSSIKTTRYATRQLRNQLVARVPISREEPRPPPPDPKSEKRNARPERLHRTPAPHWGRNPHPVVSQRRTRRSRRRHQPTPTTHRPHHPCLPIRSSTQHSANTP